MKCPECIKQGKKSMVTQHGTVVNATYHPVMWDEEGNIVDTGHAGSQTEYSCSQGHRWTVKL